MLPIKNIFGDLVCHYGFNSFYLNAGVVPANIFTLNNAPGVALAVPQEPARTVLLADTIGIPGKILANHLSTYVLPPSQPDFDYWLAGLASQRRYERCSA